MGLVLVFLGDVGFGFLVFFRERVGLLRGVSRGLVFWVGFGCFGFMSYYFFLCRLEVGG